MTPKRGRVLWGYKRETVAYLPDCGARGRWSCGRRAPMCLWERGLRSPTLRGGLDPTVPPEGMSKRGSKSTTRNLVYLLGYLQANIDVPLQRGKIEPPFKNPTL